MKEEIEEIETKKPYREFPLFYECFKNYFKKEKAYCAIIVLKDDHGISIYPPRPGLIIVRHEFESFPTQYDKFCLDIMMTTLLCRKEDLDSEPCFLEVVYIMENGIEKVCDEIGITYKKNLDLTQEKNPAIWCKGFFMTVNH